MKTFREELKMYCTDVSEKCFNCPDIDNCPAHSVWPLSAEWERLKENYEKEIKENAVKTA